MSSKIKDQNALWMLMLLVLPMLVGRIAATQEEEEEQANIGEQEQTNLGDLLRGIRGFVDENGRWYVLPSRSINKKASGGASLRIMKKSPSPARFNYHDSLRVMRRAGLGGLTGPRLPRREHKMVQDSLRIMKKRGFDGDSLRIMKKRGFDGDSLRIMRRGFDGDSLRIMRRGYDGDALRIMKKDYLMEDGQEEEEEEPRDRSAMEGYIAALLDGYGRQRRSVVSGSHLRIL